jgi:hypothetical protein
VDDVWVGREERVGFYFFEGLRDGFLAEGAADFFEGVELLVCVVLDEVDVREAALFWSDMCERRALAMGTYLAQQTLYLEAPAVYLEVW